MSKQESHGNVIAINFRRKNEAIRLSRKLRELNRRVDLLHEILFDLAEEAANIPVLKDVSGRLLVINRICRTVYIDEAIISGIEKAVGGM